EVQSAIDKKTMSGQFDFVGKVAEDQKWALYEKADLFVMPSKSENFGIAIAEAMACGVPVITTRGTPWEELVTHRCGWWIEPNPVALADALRHALSLSDAERHEMGRRGRQLIESKYTWPRVAGEMKSVYEWVLGLGPKPNCVLSVGDEVTSL